MAIGREGEEDRVILLLVAILDDDRRETRPTRLEQYGRNDSVAIACRHISWVMCSCWGVLSLTLLINTSEVRSHEWSRPWHRPCSLELDLPSVWWVPHRTNFEVRQPRIRPHDNFSTSSTTSYSKPQITSQISKHGERQGRTRRSVRYHEMLRKLHKLSRRTSNKECDRRMRKQY